MAFYKWLAGMRELSYYVLTRGILLSCALLASSLVLLVWAGGYSVQNDLLYEYAAYIQTMALIVMATGLIGSALIEDTLNHTT